VDDVVDESSDPGLSDLQARDLLALSLAELPNLSLDEYDR
jgi:hypothetical protein